MLTGSQNVFIVIKSMLSIDKLLTKVNFLAKSVFSKWMGLIEVMPGNEKERYA